MSRPTRREILEYALEGATTRRGVQSGNLDDDEEQELDQHIQWLEREIQRVKGLGLPTGGQNQVFSN